MIGGNPHEFLDTVYNGEEIYYLYSDVKYFCQGYTKDGFDHCEVIKYDHPEEGYIWQWKDKSSEGCLEAFMKAPIFDGKAFWDAEQEIQWVDD